MSSTASTTKNRLLEAVPAWWPVLLTLLAVGGTAVQASSKIADQGERLGKVEQSVQAMPAQLARIEANQASQKEQLNRLEDRLERAR